MTIAWVMQPLILVIVTLLVSVQVNAYVQTPQVIDAGNALTADTTLTGDRISTEKSYTEIKCSDNSGGPHRVTLQFDAEYDAIPNGFRKTIITTGGGTGCKLSVHLTNNGNKCLEPNVCGGDFSCDFAADSTGDFIELMHTSEGWVVLSSNGAS